MALFEVEQSVLDGLEEDVKAKFAVYEPEDVSGLKNKANEAVNKEKEVKAELLAVKAELAQAKVNKPAGDASKLQQELDSAKQKLTDSETSLTELKGQVLKSNINGEAGKLAALLTKDTGKASILTEKFASRLSFEDGEMKVLDSHGKLTVSSQDELSTEIKGMFPFLVDGSPSAGGGATGTRGGAGAEVKEMSRADFGKKTPADQMAFIKSGGETID